MICSCLSGHSLFGLPIIVSKEVRFWNGEKDWLHVLLAHVERPCQGSKRAQTHSNLHLQIAARCDAHLLKCTSK